MCGTVGCEVIALLTEHLKGITLDLVKRIDLALASLSRQGHEADATQVI